MIVSTGHFAVMMHLFSLGFSLIHDNELVPGQWPDRWQCSWPWLGEYISHSPNKLVKKFVQFLALSNCFAQYFSYQGPSHASCSGVLHFKGAIYINCYAMSVVILEQVHVHCLT